MVKKKSKSKVIEEAKPLDHVLVPPVQEAGEDELKQLVDQQGITRDKLPLIFSNDPAIAYLKLNPGSVVKFIRTSLVTGEQKPYYRLVIQE